MRRNSSLLGQFYTRIRGSQEGIASEGLSYLLNRSAKARDGLSSVIYQKISIQFPSLVYHTQVVGESQERPDIIGLDESGKERLILEAKFWAALTDNQPNQYIRRLISDRPAALVFVCPELRVRSLWHELVQRVSSLEEKFEIEEGRHIIRLDAGVTIGIITWPELLNILRDSLLLANEHKLVSDIDQIIGFCEVIDQNAFRPISSNDLSPSNAGRLISYYDLTDKLVEELKKNVPVDLSGMKATAQRWGYCRYFKIGKIGIALMVNFDLWASEVDTPFWVSFQTVTLTDWRTDDSVLNGVREAKSRGLQAFYPNASKIRHFALAPQLNVTEDLILKDLSVQVKDLIDCFSMTNN